MHIRIAYGDEQGSAFGGHDLLHSWAMRSRLFNLHQETGHASFWHPESANASLASKSNQTAQEVKRLSTT
jgi:hypothetical protein